MTEKALEKLSQNPKGFFLFVEGSKVDIASHGNDPVGIVSEVLSYEKAFKVALDYAKKHPNTIVIGVEDHANGGLSIGGPTLDRTYDKAPLNIFIDPLKRARGTAAMIVAELKPDLSNIGELAARYFGIADLSAEEIDLIRSMYRLSIELDKDDPLRAAFGRALAKRANLAFTTTGHTGEDVPLYCWRARGECLSGVVENIDVNRFIARELGLNLEKTTDELFVSVRRELAGKAEFMVDRSLKATPVLHLSMNGKRVSFPANRNYFLNESKEKVPFDGVTVIQGDDAWIARDALKKIH